MKPVQTAAQRTEARVYLARRVATVMSQVFAPDARVVGEKRADDAALTKSMARDAAEQKMHAGAAAAAATDAKNKRQATTHPQAAMRAPSAALTPASVRVAPTSSASGAKARGFADRARAAAK